MSGSELFDIYRDMGPDPYILYEQCDWFKSPYTFNAWSYAEIACRQLCGEAPGLPSNSPAALKGRYSEYNRLQMTAHLLMWRQVRVTRDLKGILLGVTAGTKGRIGFGSPYFSGDEFDWSIELPVIFEREGMDDVTFGIPYELLEFTQSDSEHLKFT